VWTVFTTRRQQGPVQELTCCQGFFCDQVFFGYDPSSSTSLGSRTVTAGSVGIFQERPQHIQTTPDTKCDTLDNERCWAQYRSSPTPNCNVRAQCRSSPNITTVSSATRSSLIMFLLLQPVFFLRSASRPDPTL